MSAFTPLATERLRIRQFVPTTGNGSHYTGDAQTMHFVEAHPMTEAQTRQFIAENMGDEAKHFAIELRDERRLLGHLGFHPWFSTHTYEIGWVLHPRYHGQGYATEAAAEMLRYGFETLRLHRVIATCQPENPASWRVMENSACGEKGISARDTSSTRTRGGTSISTPRLEEDWFGTETGKEIEKHP